MQILISKYQGNFAIAKNFLTFCNAASEVPVKPKASHLESLKDPLKEDEVGVVDGGLLRHIFNLHLGLLLAALLFLPLLLLLLLLLPLLLLVLLLSVPALAVLLQASEKELSKSVQKKKINESLGNADKTGEETYFFFRKTAFIILI